MTKKLEDITKEEIDLLIYPRYKCLRHGVIDQIFSSNIPDYEGKWCMRCIINVLNANPCIHRVTDATDEEKKKWQVK